MVENDALNHKVFTQQFIDLYETLPELWNPKNLAYIDKNKRNQALDKLLNICKKVNKNATREDVRKKINTLRSNYKKEMNKIIASKSSGARPEDVYKPTSWTFYALKFLHNTETTDSDCGNEKVVSIFYLKSRFCILLQILLGPVHILGKNLINFSFVVQGHHKQLFLSKRFSYLTCLRSKRILIFSSTFPFTLSLAILLKIFLQK